MRYSIRGLLILTTLVAFLSSCRYQCHLSTLSVHQPTLDVGFDFSWGERVELVLGAGKKRFFIPHNPSHYIQRPPPEATLEGK